MLEQGDQECDERILTSRIRAQALKIESRLKECKNPADTHLNICACQSQLGRHNEALEHAQAALILLQVWIALLQIIVKPVWF